MDEILGYFRGKRVTLMGRFGGMSKRDAATCIRAQGGIVSERPTRDTDILIVGEEESVSFDTLLHGIDPLICESLASNPPEIIRETQLWQRLGLLDTTDQDRRLYTPAMLAELLRLPVTIIRRWHRCGLIVPIREVRRLPYFDFREIVTARRLAEMLDAGISPEMVAKKLDTLGKLVGNVQRPLEQLSVMIEGREILLRTDGGLVEPGGQLRFDFDACETNDLLASEDDENPLPLENRSNQPLPSANGSSAKSRLPIVPSNSNDEKQISNVENPNHTATHTTNFDDINIDTTQKTGKTRKIKDRKTENTPQSEAKMLPQNVSVKELMDQAGEYEDAEDFCAAIDTLRSTMAMCGPKPELCFRIAELLYRTGDRAAARERYFMTVELDENYVEARANLGCVLAEEGRSDLAIAAFDGALVQHPDYADVHYHLARIYQDRYDELVQRRKSQRLPLFPEETSLSVDSEQDQKRVQKEQVEAELEQQWRQLASQHWTRFLELAPSSPWAEEAAEILEKLQSEPI